MVSTKTIIQQDTLVSKQDDLVYNQNEYRNFKTVTIENDNSFCNCTFMNNIIWPITILIIIFLFYKQLKTLIRDISHRIKRGDGFKIGPSGIEMSREMDPKELNSKAEKEYEETVIVEENQDSKIKESDFIPKYFGIERRIFNLLLKHVYPEYRVLSNRKMQGYEFDFIIETLGKKDFDLIGEVKFFPNKINKAKLRDILLKINFLNTIYENTTQRKVRSILFIVVGDDITVGEYNNILDYTNEYYNSKNLIRTIITKETDIEAISKLEILNILNIIQ